MALTPTVLISGQGDFISGFVPAAAAIAESFFGDPSSLQQIINPDILAAEASANEGDRLSLVLSNFRAYVPTQGMVSEAGAAAAWLNGHVGSVMDPATGETLQPWPEYGPQIAWGDDSTATLTIRWRKGQDWLLILLVVLAAGILAALLYLALGGSKYTLSKWLSGLTSPGGLGGISVFGIPLWLWGLGIVGLYFAPDLVRGVRRIERAERGG
jgi:hypothetical protein